MMMRHWLPLEIDQRLRPVMGWGRKSSEGVRRLTGHEELADTGTKGHDSSLPHVTPSLLGCSVMGIPRLQGSRGLGENGWKILEGRPALSSVVSY